MSDRELKLNSLSRFSKQSPRFILEEYNSCEVPSGCGGVVLRWRQPDEPIPMSVDYFALNGMVYDLQLDGEMRLSSRKTPVTYGDHIISCSVHDFDPAFAFLLLTAHLNADYMRMLQPEGDTTILSLPDNTWKYTLAPMEDAQWQKLDFDDSDWRELIEKPIDMQPKFRQHMDISGWLNRYFEQGAVGLGIDTDQPEVAKLVSQLLDQNGTIPRIYIRKTFNIRKKIVQE